MNEITITVTLADRNYRLTVKKEEEELVRKAALEVNQRLKKYSEQYSYTDYQDLLAMISLEMALYLETDKRTTMHNEQILNERIQNLEQLIDPYI
ncbi:MAG: cell division protein ZapA [Bacteroidales bacterium]|jgi:cell division protein ZapA|nr:cell division protein ZapA [Bacteroidales bacterium]NPV37186.1 cell division protein ZapA [Bacteroidales bacterium]